MNRENTVSFQLSDAEKRKLRILASRRGLSMAEQVRRELLPALNEVETEPVPDLSLDEPEPMEDFIEAHLVVDPSADPVPKSKVYEWYRDFCAETYPEHKVETQNKLSREVGSLNGVHAGREYINDGSELVRMRCFDNLRRADGF